MAKPKKAKRGKVTQPGLFEDTPEVVIWREPTQRKTVADVLMLGAGLQSTVIAEMAVEGELSLDLAVFSDTGNEPFWVYKQVDYLRRRLDSVGIPLYIGKKKDSKGITVDLQEKVFSRFASMPLFTRKGNNGSIGQLRRQCTNEYKIEPGEQACRKWMVEKGYAYIRKGGAMVVHRKYKVNMLFGFTTDESDRSIRTSPAWQDSKYPLLERGMSRNDCHQWLLEHELPVPMKSSCIVCPYHSNAHWQYFKENAPELFEEACQFDEWLRTADNEAYPNLQQPTYVHRSCTPLREVDFTIPTGISPFQEELFGDTCQPTDGGFSCFS